MNLPSGGWRGHGSFPGRRPKAWHLHPCLCPSCRFSFCCPSFQFPFYFLRPLFPIPPARRVLLCSYGNVRKLPDRRTWYIHHFLLPSFRDCGNRRGRFPRSWLFRQVPIWHYRRNIRFESGCEFRRFRKHWPEPHRCCSILHCRYSRKAASGCRDSTQTIGLRRCRNIHICRPWPYGQICPLDSEFAVLYGFQGRQFLFRLDCTEAGKKLLSNWSAVLPWFHWHRWKVYHPCWSKNSGKPATSLPVLMNRPGFFRREQKKGSVPVPECWWFVWLYCIQQKLQKHLRAGWKQLPFR